MKTTVLVVLVALAACRSGPPQPVGIDAGDMCSRCRMAILETRYAAELLEADGNALKFDDIGCMVRYAADHHLGPNARPVFVMDYQAQRWLQASEAVYVHSAAIPTPMSGGFAAFGDREKAKAFARTVHGELLRFEDIWTSQF